MDNPWISMDNLWISMDNPWISMDVPWISMDIHGSSMDGGEEGGRGGEISDFSMIGRTSQDNLGELRGQSKIIFSRISEYFLTFFYIFLVDPGSVQESSGTTFDNF